MGQRPEDLEKREYKKQGQAVNRFFPGNGIHAIFDAAEGGATAGVIY